MSKIECEDGLIELGTNSVAEPRSVSWTEEVSSRDRFAMGDTRPSRRFRPGLITGQMAYFWDPDDTDGQVAISANGTASTLKVYPTGKNEGDPLITFGTVHFGNDAKSGEAEGDWERTVDFSADAITESTYSTN